MRYHPHKITTNLSAYEQFFLFTDASSDGSANGLPMLGGIIITPSGETRAFAREAPEWEGLRIESMEAAAVLEALNTFSDLIKGKHVVLAVDNTVVLYGMIKGDSRAATVAKYVQEIAAVREELGARVWVEFVKSEYNPADGFSRQDLFCDFMKATTATLVDSEAATIAKTYDKDHLAAAEELLAKAAKWEDHPEMWGRARYVLMKVPVLDASGSAVLDDNGKPLKEEKWSWQILH